jgi:hypothetical protein
MDNLSRRSILIGLPTLFALAAVAAEKRLALKGYDPVSYFTEGRPEQGSAEYQAAFDDATYWFKNADHRAMFVADPDHYAPQFRGYCTVTLSRGSKLEADPEAWAIADGSSVFRIEAGRSDIQSETASVVEKASDNWAKLRNTP